MKDACKTLLRRSTTVVTRVMEASSSLLGQARRSLAARGNEIGRRSAPALAAARRAAERLASIAGPVTRPLRRVIGKIAPFVARIPLLIGAIGVAVIAGIASTIERAQFALTNQLLPVLTRGVANASRTLTPIRIGTFSCLIAAGLLIGSQFLDYRGVAVGEALYKGQIAVDAPAPITATAVTGDAHFWVMIPIALIAALVSIASLRSGNQRLGVLVCALGLIAAGIALAVDLPKGLDPVSALPYSDATTRLLGGFWAELFAGVALIVSGGVLARGNTVKPSRHAAKRVRHSADLATAGGS